MTVITLPLLGWPRKSRWLAAFHFYLIPNEAGCHSESCFSLDRSLNMAQSFVTKWIFTTLWRRCCAIPKSGGPGAVPSFGSEVSYVEPIIDLSSVSSSVTWSSYHKSLLASSDYEGTVTLWDAFTGVKSRIFQVTRNELKQGQALVTHILFHIGRSMKSDAGAWTSMPAILSF